MPIRSLLLAALAVVLVAQPAGAGDIPPGRFGVGDSIMLSASDELAPIGYVVNAEVGRQFSAGLDVVRRKAVHGTLPRTVVVHLGTNGPIPTDGCEQLVAAAGTRRIFVLTVKVPRPWELANNELLRACAASSERVFIVRWYAKATAHPEWLADDGYHLSADGQTAYAALIDRVVDDTLASLRAAR